MLEPRVSVGGRLAGAVVGFVLGFPRRWSEGGRMFPGLGLLVLLWASGEEGALIALPVESSFELPAPC